MPPAWMKLGTHRPVRGALNATLHTPARRDILRSFKHRDFSIYFAGQTISMIGTWSQMLAVSWLVWRMTGSPLWLGVVGFAMQLPTLILGLAGGALADRFERAPALRAVQILSMLQALALAWLTISGALQLWHILILCLALGTIYAFEFPVRLALVADVVGKDDLLNATSLTNASTHVSRVLGPAIAGLIVAWKGEGACFLFNAAAFLAFIAALSMMERVQRTTAGRESKSVINSIKEGLAYLRAIPDARISIALIAALAGIGMQFTTLMPMFAQEVFGGGARQLGWLIAASAVGSLLGALWLAARPDATHLLGLAARSALVFSIALIVFAIAGSIYPAMALLAIMGLCFTISFSSMATLIQREAPDHMRGRMMGLYTMAYMGIGPIGYLLAGFSARMIGAQPTVAISGLICLVASAWIVARMPRPGECRALE
ncbi:MAG: MFS transporter [bacterium]